MKYEGDTSNIDMVYSGKIGCMCGCRGKYTYNDGIARGVKIIANKVLNDPRVHFEENWAEVVDEERGTHKVVYFKQ